MREVQLAASLREEGSIPGAIQHLRTALDLEPKNAEAEILLGWIYYERRDLPKAVEHVGRGVRLLEAQDREGSTLAEARNMFGIILIDTGEHAEAVEVLELSATDVMNRAPHLAYGNLGMAFLAAGRREDALAALQRSVELQPRFCVGHFRIGRLQFEGDRFEEAEEALVQALEADPACADARELQPAWLLRGEARARLGLREEALADFERCVVLGPQTAEGRRCQAFLDGGH
ncbi:MAG: tetratricopeptide repeat protein [Polyangiaceae bacterium]|nr:tetratricopeptide repeat protein [Polyangiaceae bacterium]